MTGKEKPSTLHHRRRTIRLAGYDYTHPGAYFLTIDTWQYECLFGEIVNSMMILNEMGELVSEEWLKTPEIRREIQLDVFQIMPNHLHGIIIINDVGAHGRAPLPNGSQPIRQPHSLGSFVAGFKSVTTKRINIFRDTPGAPVWQRNYYEHVIRSEDELEHIRQYILANPLNWVES